MRGDEQDEVKGGQPGQGRGRGRDVAERGLTKGLKRDVAKAVRCIPGIK